VEKEEDGYASLLLKALLFAYQYDSLTIVGYTYAADRDDSIVLSLKIT
jgi:hypothetical protein